MMKHLLWLGLVSLTVLAAQCNASPPAAETASRQTSPTLADEEKVSPQVAAAGEQITPEKSNTTAAPAAETNEAEMNPSSDAGQQPPTAESGDHSAACDDPFAGASVRFSPELWAADDLADLVPADIIDPDSDLATNFCLHNVDYADIVSGGPPPDGIPPLDNPQFDSIAEGDEWLADVQPVIALAVGDEAKAYPLAILTRHEIANDEIASLPVAVTFCPLCNAGIVFKREVDGEVLRFGVSGNLRHSNLIMWDNKTLSWWQQFTGQAIVGDMTGVQLEMLPAQLVSWQDFKEAYPTGQVLSASGRAYGRNPYVGYDSSAQPFLFQGTPDPRLPATARVLGYFSGDMAVAYPMSVIAEEGVIEDTLNGQRAVIFYKPGQVSALDQGIIEESREVGSAGMFNPEVDGQKLTFTADKGVITDNETGSEWNVFGRAISGELAGSQLEPVLGHPYFWFAWAAFRPDTTVYGQ
ncbi:MAG: DUF3179 domain-containing protein [Anaerolineae bacterium]|nr:DUF3179 domain-containing protein [Anaerolineae bacterium]